MNSREQSWRFLSAGAVCAFTLAAITVFALRAEVPRESAVVACLVDVVLQAAFAAAGAFALRASGWSEGLEAFTDHGTPSLRSLSVIAPWLVLLQIGMGAALRYRLMGAISHVAGAMLVGAFLLYFATGVMAPAPKGHPSRTAALVLRDVGLAQVVLGLGAYVVRFGQGEGNGLTDSRLFSILHIIAGALTLAGTLVLGILVRKSSQKQEATGLPSLPTA